MPLKGDQVVRLEPRPWVFGPRGIRVQPAAGNRWRVVTLGPKHLHLRNVRSGALKRLARALIHSFVKPDILRLKAQVLIVGQVVSLEPLPPGYWSEPR